uniref:Uncharacterized protein LOC104236699 n=1 Tax=Nicotiana sylvestris TaxID=4096 RepID=A0A1U7XPX8_NICSY|nr:PREDICTED: uncharacterized protein LOC104236699 [Nicotiana sylvestris]
MTQSSLGLSILPPAVSNIKGFVPVKLTYINYLTWKKVFLTVLKSHNLLSLVDGIVPCLSQDNADYKLWIQCDTIAMSWINAILSPAVLDTLLNYGSIGNPVTDEDLVTQALQGLPPSYHTFVSGLNATGTLPSFIALRPLLLTEEAHIKAATPDDSNSQTALTASTQAKGSYDDPSPYQSSYSRGQNNGRGRGRTNRGYNFRGRGQSNQHSPRSFSPQWPGFQSSFRHPSPMAGVLGCPPFNPSNQCQICFHFNHTALEYKNKFNHSYASNVLPKSFAAISLEEVRPTTWYPDSGASAHMTHDPTVLSSPSSYTGSSQVMVGNGNLLPILSTGTSTIPTSSRPLPLRNFTDTGSFVKDKKTNQVLLHHDNVGSLYPFQVIPSSSSHLALSCDVSSPTIWHQRLGHLGQRSLTALVHRKLIPYVSSFDNNSYACLSATHLINIFPLPVLNFSSPYEMLFGCSPDYNLFKVFGCLCFPFTALGHKNKFEPRSILCLFLGTSTKHKGFKCLDPTTNKVLISRHVKFVKNIFPYLSMFPSNSQAPFLLKDTDFKSPDLDYSPTLFSSQNDITHNLSDNLNATSYKKSSPSMHVLDDNSPTKFSNSKLSEFSSASSPIFSRTVEQDLPSSYTSSNLQEELSPSSHDSFATLSSKSITTSHSHIPHSRGNLITNSHHPILSNISTSPEGILSQSPSNLSLYSPSALSRQISYSNVVPTFSPQPLPTPTRTHKMVTRAMTGSLKPHILPSISACISSSLSEPTSYAQAIKDLRWQRAMSDEYNALIQNNTWTLVPPPPDANIIGNKWVFKIKYCSKELLTGSKQD